MGSQAIMLVEDNLDDVELTRMVFKHHITNKLIVVNDGQQALEYLFHTGPCAALTQDDAPALVLLDIKLPKINGLEVLKKMRENKATAYIPAVILTSSSEESDVANGYKNGCNSYIRKPVKFAEFADAVKALSLYWLLINEPPPNKVL